MKRDDILSLATIATTVLLPVQAFASEHGSEHGSGGASLPQLDVALYPGVLFWFAITFVLFFIVVQIWGVPGIQQTQDKRASLLGEDLSAARQASEEAQKVVDEYETALANAREKAQETVNAILVEAAKEQEASAEKLRKDLAHRTQVAEKNILEARQSAMKEAPKHVNDLVQETFAKVTQVTIGA